MGCAAKAAAPTSSFFSWGLESSASNKAKSKPKSRHKQKKKGTTYAGMLAANEVQWEMAAANTLMATPTAVSMASAAAAPPQSPTAALEAAAEAEVVAELVEA